MLFEDEFYEDGKEISERIARLIPKIDPEIVSGICIEARTDMKLRHIPLLICREMAKLEKHKAFVKTILPRIIQRPDELAEFLAIYQKSGKDQPISNAVKKGLALAFHNFNAYEFAKYNQDKEIKLRDVMRIVHPRPEGSIESRRFRKILENYCTCGHTHYNKETKKREDKCGCGCNEFVADTLPTPDTWEVGITKCHSDEEKRREWTRLLTEKKLGGLALLRNLRNMKSTGVDEDLIRSSIGKIKTDRILPFRFITAARYAPALEPELETVMLSSLKSMKKLPGKTILLVDGSGSMHGQISSKSELTRFDAACALSILAREICEKCEVIVFSTNAYVVPPRKGFALRDAIKTAAEFSSTNTEDALILAADEGYNRIIVFTDEQSHQTISDPIKGAIGYVVNIASNRNGIGYGQWIHIDGFSEKIIDFIQSYEEIE